MRQPRFGAGAARHGNCVAFNDARRAPSSRQRFRCARLTLWSCARRTCSVCNIFLRARTPRTRGRAPCRKRSDHDVSASAISRRSFLQVSASATFAGAFAAPTLAAAAEGGLVALVHTQAAGDNGPINSMIAALKKLSQGEEIPDPDDLRAGRRDLRDHLQEPRGRERRDHRRDLQRGRRADQGARAEISEDQVDPDFRRSDRAADAEFRDRFLRLLPRLLPLRSFRRQDVEDGQDRLHRRRQPAAFERGREFAQGRDRLRQFKLYIHAGLCGLVSGPRQRTRDRQPDVSGRRRLHSDRFGSHRHRHHPGGERRRGPHGQRDLARAIQDRARRPSRRWSRSISASRSTTRFRRRSDPTSRAATWPPVSGQA